MSFGKARNVVIVSVIVASILAVASVVMAQQNSPCVSGGAVPAGNAALAQDCDTLLGMKSALRGSGKLNWWSGRSLEKWDGIQVQGGRVTELSLPSSGLSGVIPAGIGNLSALTTLDLSGNSLTGTIPASLNNLTNLTRWRLAGNNLTGCVPANFAQVSDNDAASLNLPVCGGSGPAPTTTPTPQPTTMPDDDFDLLAYTADAMCFDEDIRQIFGETYTELDDLFRGGEWASNAFGWRSSISRVWSDSSADSGMFRFVFCHTIVFDSEDSAILSSDYDLTRRTHHRGTSDVLMESKVPDTPEIGDDFGVIHFASGSRTVGNDEWAPVIDSLQTASFYRRGDRAVVVRVIEYIEDGDPLTPPSVLGLIQLTQRIDDYLTAIDVDTTSAAPRVDSIRGFSANKQTLLDIE